MNNNSISVVFADSSHAHYAQRICDLIYESALQRGTGIAKRSPEYIAAKMTGGKAVVALDGEKKVVAAWAGDLEEAHAAGVQFIREQSQCPSITGDIVITSNGGYPLDQNIYQSVKGMTAAEVTVKEGGVIIMLSKAADGHGGKYFHETFRDEKDLNRMMKTFMDRKPEETIIDQWQSQIFARVMLKARIVFVSSCDDKLVEELHMIPAHTMEEALNKAKAMVNKEDYKVTVIPDGVSVIVRG